MCDNMKDYKLIAISESGIEFYINKKKMKKKKKLWGKRKNDDE